MKAETKKLRFKDQEQNLVTGMKRGIFKAIDPYQQSQQFVFKSKKAHFRHHSQPISEMDGGKKQSKSNHVTESIQQILKKAHKVSHMRLMSEMSESTRSYKKPKQNDFMYNKWYIKPELRLKKANQNPFQSHQLFSQTDGFKMHNQPYFRQSQIIESKNQEPFNQKQSPNVIFAKKFNNSRDKKNLNLLKEFKRKQVFKKGRTPQLVDLILEMNKKKKENDKNSLRSVSKKTTTFQESFECSKNPSKFFIEDNELMRTSTAKKRTLLESSRKQLTLNESKYLEIKKKVNQTSRLDQTYDGFKISKFQIQ